MSILGAFGGLVGNLISGSSASKNAKLQMAKQEEAARNSVQWRVADAKKAGVGTLAAMGMQPISMSPVSVNGPDWGSVGQNLGRALDAGVDRETQAHNVRAQQLSIEKMELENDAIKLQLLGSARALRQQAGTPPGVPDSLQREVDRQSIRGEAESIIRSRDGLPMGSIGVVPQSPRWSPAQKVEDEYSDIVSNIYGVAKWLRDYNLMSRPPASNPMTKRYWQNQIRDYRAGRVKDYYRRRGDADFGYW